MFHFEEEYHPMLTQGKDKCLDKQRSTSSSTTLCSSLLGCLSREESLDEDILDSFFNYGPLEDNRFDYNEGELIEGGLIGDKKKSTKDERMMKSKFQTRILLNEFHLYT